MALAATVLLLVCIALAVRIWRRRRDAEGTPAIDEALERAREALSEPRTALRLLALLALPALVVLGRVGRWPAVVAGVLAIAAAATWLALAARRRERGL